MRRAIFLLIQRSVRRVARGASRAPRRAFFKAHPATAARDDEKCTHDRMRRVCNDELVPVANSISLPCASHVAPVHAPRCGFLRDTRARRLLLIRFFITKSRDIVPRSKSSNYSLYTCVCIYIYMDIARWILHVVVTTNPRLPIQPVYEKAEFNAGLRVPALNKLDTVILKERRTNHGGLIFSRSRFRLATQPHLPLL